MVSNAHRNCPCPTPEEDELDEVKMPRPDLPRRANSLHAKFLRDLPQRPGEIQSPQKDAEELWESDNAPLQASNLIARSRPWLAESFKYPNADMVFGDMLKVTPLPTDEDRKLGYMAYSRPPTPGSLTELAGVESSAGTSHPRRQSLYPATPINSETPKRSAKSTISTNSRSSTISSGSRDSAICMLPEDRDNLSGRAYLCELCSMHFSSSSKLSRHRKEHANPTCIYCGELKTEDLRKQHYATCHKHLCFGLTGGNDDSVSVPRDDTISPYGDVAVIRDLAYFQSESYSTEPKSYMQGVGSVEDVYSKSLNLFDTSPITREVDSYRSIIQSNQISKDSLLRDPALRLDLDCHSPSKICEEEIQSAVLDPAARLETDSSFSEYETDLEDEDTIDDSPDIDFSKVSQTWHESPENARGEVISRVLTPMQQALLDQMMTEFWVIFKQEIDSFPKELTCPIDDTHQGQTQELVDSQEGQCDSNTEQPVSRTEFATPISTLTSASALKRKRGKEKDEGDENDDERNPKQPRVLSYVPADAEPHLKFACPYRKNNPVKYSVREWRSCALTPLDTVARVKAHLYRHHRIFPCQRCKTLFKSQGEVNEHQKEPEPCLLAETELGDGLTSDIVEKLKSRKKSDKNQTESERWREIYKLLFPQDLVPDPYFEAVQENLSQSPDSRELENYEVFCRQELPRSVRHALEELIRSQSSPIEEILRNQLVSIIRDCQDRVFSRYRESLGPAGGSPIRTRTGSVSSATISSTAAPPKALSNDAKASASTANNGSVLTFLQPPPPQNDLGSQKICDAVLKPAAANRTSDSGYTSSSDPPPPASPRINRRSSLFPLNPPAPPSEPAPEQPLPANPWPNPPVFDKQCAEDEHSSPLMDGLGGSGYFSPVDSELYDLFDKGADVEYFSPSIQGLDGTGYIPPVDQGFYDPLHDPDNYE